MKPVLKGCLKFFLGACLVIVVGIIGLFAGLKIMWAHPSDEALLANFNAHRAGFERLIEMIREDKGLERVDVDWTRPDDPASIGISDARIQTYRRMFASLNVPRGFYSYRDPTRVHLLAHTAGFAFGGSAKGYAYQEVRPDPVIDRLDDFHGPVGESAFAYRHIEGHWYLFYEFNN